MKWTDIKKWLVIAGIATGTSYILGFLLNCAVYHDFHFKLDLRLLFHKNTLSYAGVLLLVALIIWLMYYHKYNRCE